MAYTKQTWIDNVSIVDAERMKHMLVYFLHL